MKNVNKVFDTTVVANASVILAASWTGNYVWTGGQTTQSVKVSFGWPVTYTVTDANGCITDVFRINISGNPEASPFERTITHKDLPVKVYPTLVNRGQQVRVQAASNITGELVLKNMTGKLLLKENFAGTKLVETNNLLPGVYILSINIKNKIQQVKFVVAN